MKKYLIAIAVAFVVVLVVLMTLSYPKVPVSVKGLKLSDYNYVINLTTKSYMDTIIRAGLDEMDIKDVVVLVRPLEHESSDPFLELKAFIVEFKQGEYIIEIKEDYLENEIEVMSHELVHLQQYLSDRLILSRDYIYWDGNLIPESELPDYFSREWEVEAREEGLKYSKILKEKLIKK